ncbi:MAG: 3-dehydroquinate synthase [Planctomycetales bacterium]|nr:3-dehydroquinate synthase [Planctomycetales bacterium]
MVRVNLKERAYDIVIGAGALAGAGTLTVSRTRATHAVVITDKNVEADYAHPVAERLAAAGCRVEVLVVPPGEASKSIASASVLWEKLLELNVDRKTVIVAVGGGVIGDLAGFVAATFARGLDFVQVPTTLLAQVDSSVGGKTGVNLPTAKNMVGAFWQPRAVLIDIAALDTLPLREYRAGLAEVVKYGMIMDADFFEFLEQHVPAILARDHATLTEIVARCCRLKAAVVEADEREESGRRSILNYGHTFCHAFEAATGYGQLLHGEAVAIGMVCAARLAQSLGRIGANVAERQHELLMALGLPVDVPTADHDHLLSLMQRDKKVEHGRLRFVLPSRLGDVELVGEVDEAAVRAALVG